jgi:hypothetical protein
MGWKSSDMGNNQHSMEKKKKEAAMSLSIGKVCTDKRSKIPNCICTITRKSINFLWWWDGTKIDESNQQEGIIIGFLSFPLHESFLSDGSLSIFFQTIGKKGLGPDFRRR